jgi:hypothetical protein
MATTMLALRRIASIWWIGVGHVVEIWKMNGFGAKVGVEIEVWKINSLSRQDNFPPKKH